MTKARTKKTYTYDFPRPSVTVDIAVVTGERVPRVLLIRRKHEPFAGLWAIPGGFVEANEKLIEAARRELLEETGVRLSYLEQLQTFGDPGRDPRGWTISVVYLAVVNAKRLKPKAADDAAEVAWHPMDKLPPLAFDHDQILAVARKALGM
jgi:8-oxo-dGTP diphosphatase